MRISGYLMNKQINETKQFHFQNLDLLALTKTWHASSSAVALRRSTPPGYSCIDRPRLAPQTRIAREVGSLSTTVPHSRSGRSGYNLHQRHLKRWPSWCHFRTVLSLSSPGSSRPTPAYFNELATMLEQFVLYNTQVVLIGDLNLHLEDPSLLETSEFETILRQFGLAQHVAEPTHRAGGWLDVIVTRDDTSPVDLEVFPPTISDHGLTTVTLPFLRVVHVPV